MVLLLALAAVGAVTEGRNGTAPGPAQAAGQVDVAGTFSTGDKISVANLTVAPHEYDITIAFDARLRSIGVPNSLRCGVIDNNGFRRFFLRDEKPVRSSADWERHTIRARVALPDLTMGLRCVPERTALISANFRAIQFDAVEVDRRRQDEYGAEGFGRSTFG